MKFPKFRRKKSVRSTPAAFLAEQCNYGQLFRESDDDLDSLVHLINLIRPRHPNKVAMVDLSELLQFLRDNTVCALQLSDYVRSILHRKTFNKFLSDAAILQDVDFLYEVRKRIGSKILPYQPQRDRLEFVLNQVFYLATDIVWISKIPMNQLEELFTLLRFDTIYESVEKDSPLSEILVAMNLIIQRISGRAMETDVIKMVPEFDDLESPFTAFEVELLQIEERIRMSGPHSIASSDLSYRQLSVLLRQCEDFVDKAFSNSAKYGISLRANQGLLKIRQQLERLRVLKPLLVVDGEDDKRTNSVELALQLIRYNCYKNNVRKFIGESTQLISYEITQHTAKTGENYITHGRKEYVKMLRTALGGGIIVGFLCIIKLFLAKVDTSYFGHAIVYSANYAFGFITIYLLGFTLATKQPAMTAAALVKALEDGVRSDVRASIKYQAFAVLFARVFRSQFIAFVGNVITAFSIPLLLVWLVDYLTGYNIGLDKWPKLIVDQSPAHSPAVLHAAIAGVYLFLSGIISGSVANRDKYQHVYYRIKEHPLLKRSFGRKRAEKLSQIYEKKGAGVISNFWFGVFMGTTASVGMFLGLNIDVRHITFASGNLALGLYGSGFDVPTELVIWAAVGVGIIGLVNFAVSFGLSLGLAFRSRNFPLSHIRYVLLSIWQHFKSHPWSFIFPVEKREAPAVGEQQLKNG